MTEEEKLLQLVSQLPLEKWRMEVQSAFVNDDVEELKLEANEDAYAKYVISIIEESIIPKVKKEMVHCNKLEDFIQKSNSLLEIELQYKKFLNNPNYFGDKLMKVPYPRTPYNKIGENSDYYVQLDALHNLRNDDFEFIVSCLKTILLSAGLSLEEENYCYAGTSGMIFKISGSFASYLYLDYIVNNWKKYLSEPQKVKKR